MYAAAFPGVVVTSSLQSMPRKFRHSPRKKTAILVEKRLRPAKSLELTGVGGGWRCSGWGSVAQRRPPFSRPFLLGTKCSEVKTMFTLVFQDPVMVEKAHKCSPTDEDICALAEQW